MSLPTTIDEDATLNSKVPVKFFENRIKGKVAVRRLNPWRDGVVEETILRGGEKIAVYSKRELAYFLTANEKLLQRGLLMATEVVEKEIPLEIRPSPNVITDKEIEELLSGRGSYSRLRQRCNQITEPAVISRILDVAIRLNRGHATIEYLQDRYQELLEQQNRAVTVKLEAHYRNISDAIDNGPDNDGDES